MFNWTIVGEKTDNTGKGIQLPKSCIAMFETYRLFLWLLNINDSIASTVDDTDIDDMDTFYSNVNQINTDNNYSYDAEGRLVKDRQEEIRRDLASDKKNVIFDYTEMNHKC